MTALPRRSIFAVLFILALSATQVHANPFGTAASVPLYPPPNATYGTGTEDNQQRGIFITAIKDFEVCGIGVGVKLAVPDTITIAIYTADGNQANTLLCEESFYEPDTTSSFNTYPISCTLAACQDYDIRVSWNDATSWSYANEAGATLPYDESGLIRVRDGEANGDASADRIPNLLIMGESTGPSTMIDLSPVVAWQGCGTVNVEQRGIYITPTKTLSVCAIGFDVGYSSPPYWITADIYDATGTTRGDRIARGFGYVLTDTWEVQTIPINAVLLEGHDYDISVEIPQDASFSCRSESDFALPYFVDNTIEVRDGENSGNASNTFLPHLQIRYNEGVGGPAFDIAPTPTQSSTMAENHGFYVTALTDVDIYSVGWYAVVPPGATVTARVYEATGTTRGAMISEGTVLGRVFAPAWWHDVPVAARLANGQDYDIEIVMGSVTEWYYRVTVGEFQPYVSGGLLLINSPESSGNAAGVDKLIQARVNACEGIASAVGPVAASPRAPVYLAAPTPNPVTAVSTIAYQLDAPAPVEIALYDVAGRKVALLLRQDAATTNGVATIDATGLVSGVYFAKLSTATSSVSRKILVVK